MQETRSFPLQGDPYKSSIALMTWYSYRNYGTALQAAAMSRTVSKLGYHPLVISYDPRKVRRASVTAKRSLAQRALKKAKRLLSPRPMAGKERDASFDRFISSNLEFTEALPPERLPELSEQFDAFVCGSDQIWSPRCFDASYYLDFVKDSQKKIAYAPSFGCDSIEDDEIACCIASLLREFRDIAVREESGASIVESLIGERPKVVLDPTLLLDADEWHDFEKPYPVGEEPYCLLYFLGNCKGNERAAYRIAGSAGLRVLEVPVFQNRQGRPGVLGPDVGPAEFVSLVQHASLVCTDSFHGMVFSTLYERPLVPFERFDPNDVASQNTRVYNFLSMTGLEGTLLSRSRLKDLRDFAIPQIEYRTVRERIAARRKDSLSYLSDSLASVTQRS